ncbi:MAG TPA: hypothetical protein VM715_20235, partial [Candidatus Acidoferrum sp.]|nr:hypothetical protein [Candidatus Acidoferrum sp.]
RKSSQPQSPQRTPRRRTNLDLCQATDLYQGATSIVLPGGGIGGALAAEARFLITFRVFSPRYLRMHYY